MRDSMVLWALCGCLIVILAMPAGLTAWAMYLDALVCKGTIR